jgi:recombination protein U
MGYWNSRGLRGSSFEEMINMTNRAYKEKNLAIIQKVPTPITPMKLDKNKGVITLAYFDQKSTIDYIGAAQGVPICFDAKETNQGRLPLQNIHQHQVEFMECFKRHGGVSFLLVHCSDIDRYFFLPFEVLKRYWDEAENGGRKSVPYNAFEEKYEVFNRHGFPVHYLEAVNNYLTEE